MAACASCTFRQQSGSGVNYLKSVAGWDIFWYSMYSEPQNRLQKEEVS